MITQWLPTWLLFAFAATMVCLTATGFASVKTWNYVALGDSTPAGFGVSGHTYVEYYAEFIEEDLGVKVQVRNFSRSGETTGSLLTRLRTSEKLRSALREAQVVTIWTGWNDLAHPMALFGDGTCGGEDNLACIRETVTTLNANVDAILNELLSLCNPEDTLIRIADVGIPFVDTWKHRGWFETLQGPCYEAWRDHLVEAAEKRGITVVYTYRVLNGPNGDEKLEGIYQSDGIHFNAEGHQLVARLHREVGYAYATR